MFRRSKRDVRAPDIEEKEHLPVLPSAQCTVLIAFVDHLEAHKAHKQKLFQHEGKPAERKILLDLFYGGVSPTTAALKRFSSRAMSYVIRHVLATQYAPLLPYSAFEKLEVAATSHIYVDAIQDVVTSMPLAHAALLHALCRLLHKVTQQLMIAEEGLIVHLGVHWSRPSEHAIATETLATRKQIARRLLAVFSKVAFPSMTTTTQAIDQPIATTARRSSITRRRSSCRAWTSDAAQDVNGILCRILASPEDKRDLFLRLASATDTTSTIPSSQTDDALSIHDLAGSAKRMLQRCDALVPLDAFNLSTSTSFPRAIRSLPRLHRQLLTSLLRCIQQAMADGASMDLLSAALAVHIFDQLKHTSAADIDAHRDLERAAIAVLSRVDTILEQLDVVGSMFRVAAMVVLATRRLKRRATRRREKALTSITAPSVVTQDTPTKDVAVVDLKPDIGDDDAAMTLMMASTTQGVSLPTSDTSSIGLIPGTAATNKAHGVPSSVVTTNARPKQKEGHASSNRTCNVEDSTARGNTRESLPTETEERRRRKDAASDEPNAGTHLNPKGNKARSNTTPAEKQSETRASEPQARSDDNNGGLRVNQAKEGDAPCKATDSKNISSLSPHKPESKLAPPPWILQPPDTRANPSRPAQSKRFSTNNSTYVSTNTALVHTPLTVEKRTEDDAKPQSLNKSKVTSQTQQTRRTTTMQQCANAANEAAVDLAIHKTITTALDKARSRPESPTAKLQRDDAVHQTSTRPHEHTTTPEANDQGVVHTSDGPHVHTFDDRAPSLLVAIPDTTRLLRHEDSAQSASFPRKLLLGVPASSVGRVKCGTWARLTSPVDTLDAFVRAAPASIAEHITSTDLVLAATEESVGDIVPWGIVVDLCRHTPLLPTCRARFEGLGVPLVRSESLWRHVAAVFAAYANPTTHAIDLFAWRCFCYDCAVLPTLSLDAVDAIHTTCVMQPSGDSTKATHMSIDHVRPQFYAGLHHVALALDPTAEHPLEAFLAHHVIGFAQRDPKRDATTSRELARVWSPQLSRAFHARARAIQQLYRHFATGSRVDDRCHGASRANGRLGDAELLNWLRALSIVPTIVTADHVVAMRHQHAISNDTAAGKSCPAIAEDVALVLSIGWDVLSQPEFDGLYPTMMDKLCVVLDVWGLGDALAVASIVGHDAADDEGKA
ncbi:Aste57867_21141 [Aphanomyces stellatus]|uniref:Aste57867_21141 protein n=1 Tax=Aphanomyces stellatus TaxID=120398 RepID=A0A485LIV5_9STRA|nr:hypothetical protein As57867_021073 [Aphanomyces stellatus]VFT97815.1 Aste57867_21141 [Aphanomyces stellatus]